MKYVENVNDPSNIIKIDDLKAAVMVMFGSWKYVPRSEWKLKVRDREKIASLKKLNVEHVKKTKKTVKKVEKPEGSKAKVKVKRVRKKS